MIFPPSLFLRAILQDIQAVWNIFSEIAQTQNANGEEILVQVVDISVEKFDVVS